MVNVRRIGSVSFESLLAHKIRTSLTMLGIIFGVAAVIAMLSIGEGARQDALEQLELLGIRNIIIDGSAPPEDQGSNLVASRSAGLTTQDAENLSMFDNLFSGVIPAQVIEGVKVFQADARSDARLIGTTTDYPRVMNLTMQRGTFLRPADMNDYTQVCVISGAIKRKLFDFKDPIGKMIRVGSLFYTVIGVVEDKVTGGSKIAGVSLKDVNNNIYIPLSTSTKKSIRELYFESGGQSGETHYFNRGDLDQIILQVRQGRDISEVATLVNKIMARRHRDLPDYTVTVPEALLAQSQKTQRIFNIVMGAIAGISLLVGGIGIMNIMLASVLERTREIGVRRAVGASRNDIMRQFLFESITICLIGCLIGVGTGIGLAKSISSYADWRTIISIFSIVLAVGVSTAVGLIFGFFPARKAALLDPIDALRYE
jgi:putative ABC transport system permease protein